MGKLVYIKTGQAVTGGQSAPSSGRGLVHLDGTPVERKRGTQPAKAKNTKAVTPSVSPRPMENASTGNSRPNSRLLADVRTKSGRCTGGGGREAEYPDRQPERWGFPAKRP